MLPLLLLAGVAFEILPIDLPVLDVRVVDIDADGRDDIVAVTAKHVLLFRSGKAPAIARPAATLVVVGRGLLGVVRDGRYRRVADPFGKWTEGEAGQPSLIAALGRGEPALLDAPGDLDGDGRDDPLLAQRDGFWTPGGLVRLALPARLEIRRNETFAVEYEIPVPVVGNWTGKSRELVFFHDNAVTAFSGGKLVERLPLPLPTSTRETAGIRRNHVFLRDVDRDGRLDLLVVIAKGRTGLFPNFEATARLFLGGHVYDRERKGFHRPASLVKVGGALLSPTLLDIDGDGDLDLVLATINASILAQAAGMAPGTYHLFRFENGAFVRKPAWTHHAPVPMSVFTLKPQPPVTFLPDLDGDKRPEAIALGPDVRLLAAGDNGRFTEVAKVAFKWRGRPSTGKTTAALAGETGVLVVRAAR